MENFSEYSCTKPTKVSIQGVRGFLQMIVLEENCMGAALKSDTACLPEAAAVR